MFVKLIMVTLILISFQSYGAKKECAQLLEKLQNIQSQQRQKQSLKSSVSLGKREDKAREIWWDCENNKTKSKKSNKKKKKIIRKNNESLTLKSAPQVFSSNKKIVIKGRFSGKKQLQWLEYYQRPQKCAKPKTTKVFAFCIEDKTAQQDMFEKEYQKNQ